MEKELLVYLRLTLTSEGREKIRHVGFLGKLMHILQTSELSPETLKVAIRVLRNACGGSEGTIFSLLNIFNYAY